MIISDNWKKIWDKNKSHFKSTITDNPYIPHRPFLNQVKFLIYPSEEILYGGAAGGGKSDALLMAALQYVGKEFMVENEEGQLVNDYHSLILRRSYQDLAKPNAIMNRCEQWLKPYLETGEVHWDKNTRTFTFPSNATLTFGYLANDGDLDQYQGAEFQFVGFDELTQFTERQYTYLYSRLRRLTYSHIPIRMRAGSNPGGRGHEWVKHKFINGDAPFIPSRYTENIYLDIKQYGETLDRLSELDRQQLKYGDWNAELSEGLLVNREQLKRNLISPKEYQDWKPVFNVIGIDKASTGEDEFALASITVFNNGKAVLTNLAGTTGAYPEELTRNFVKTEYNKYQTYIINFEREPGSDFHFAGQYWEDVLKEFINDGVIVKQTPDSNSKFNRARVHSRAVKDGKLLFNSELDLNTLFNQYVYVHPDKTIMKEYPSPDRLDAVSFAWMEVVKLINI